MLVRRLYLGKWFKRIDIHVEELYNVIAKNKLTNVFMTDEGIRDKIYKTLGIKSFEYTTEGGEKELILNCGRRNLVYPEDGSAFTRESVGKDVSVGEIKALVEEHRKLLNEKFGSVMKKIHPLTLGTLTHTPFQIPEGNSLYLVARKPSAAEIKEIFEAFGDTVSAAYALPEVDIHSGDKIVVFAEKKDVDERDWRVLISFLTFLRSYKMSLVSLLNDQRVRRRKIVELRKGKMTLKYIIGEKEELEKLIDQVDQQQTNIAQMKTMWKFRKDIHNYYIKKGGFLNRVIDELGIETELLRIERNHNYISNAWESLRRYCKDTLEVFEMTYSESQEMELHVIELLAILELAYIIIHLGHLSEGGFNIAAFLSGSFLASGIILIGLAALAILSVHYLSKKYIKSAVRNKTELTL